MRYHIDYKRVNVNLKSALIIGTGGPGYRVAGDIETTQERIMYLLS